MMLRKRSLQQSKKPSVGEGRSRSKGCAGMHESWYFLIFHLATIVGGVWIVRQVKRTSTNLMVALLFVSVLAAQAAPTLWSIWYSTKPGMGPIQYITIYFLIPLGAVAAVAWFVIGGAVWLFTNRKS
jgi:FtsH-binding integral membrane protein